MNNFDRHALAAIDSMNNDMAEPPFGGLEITNALRFIPRLTQSIIGEMTQQDNAISLARVSAVSLVWESQA